MLTQCYLTIAEYETLGYLFLKRGMYKHFQTVESLRRENGNQTAELREMTSQLAEGGKAEAELHKLQRRVDIEREELNVRFVF